MFPISLRSTHVFHKGVTSRSGLQPEETKDGVSPAKSSESSRYMVASLQSLAKGIKSLSIPKRPQYDGAQNVRALLQLKLAQAVTYEEWQVTASKLDNIEGNEYWKQRDETEEYDHVLVRSQLGQMEEACISVNPARILFLVRTALTRNLGGMGNNRLYTHAYSGTKVLIERYIQSALQAIDTLLVTTDTDSTAPMDSRHLLEQLLLARQAFGRSALLPSGGGTFGMNHIGVVKSLWEAKLLPRIVSGASAGSIVCAVLCSKTDDEIPTVLENFCLGDLAVFTKPGEDGFLSQASRFFKRGFMFDISNLIRVVRNIIGDLTSQEAYNRTRRILNICVSSSGLFELPRLLNYITAPNVVIWSAV